MWNVMILVVMLAVAGIYTIKNQQTLDGTQQNVAMSVAEDMALYRTAVIDYFTKYDIRDTSVNIDTLKVTGMLPEWSLLFQKPASSIWNNYRGSDGIIYIYATSLPKVNIIAEINRLSHNSILTGVFHRNVATLQSAIFGETNIPLTALNDKAVPDGAPVWIAMTK